MKQVEVISLMTQSKHAPADACEGASSKPLSKSPWVVGLDPGLKGAMAALRLDFSEYVAWKMPVISKSIDAVSVQQTLASLLSDGGIALCIVEEAQVMRKQGISSALTIGRNYGVLIGVLEVTKVPFTEVRPSEWKKAVVGSAPRVAAKAKKIAIDANAPADLLSGLDVKEISKVKPVTVRTVEDRKAAKELALITARRMFPRLTFSATEDGPAEALLMAEAGRRLVLAGSLGAPEFSTPDEAQTALDESRVQASLSPLAMRLSAASKKKAISLERPQ